MGEKETQYLDLAAKLPEEAVERASRDKTKKGYDTTGYRYQYVVDRLNEVCGLDGWDFDFEILDIREGKFQSGKPFVETAVAVTVRIFMGERPSTRRCVGGHRSDNYADALKGAITNAFKKTAAFFGVGADAYRATIDDDNQPPEHDDDHHGPPGYSREPQAVGGRTRRSDEEEYDRGPQGRIWPQETPARQAEVPLPPPRPPRQRGQPVGSQEVMALKKTLYELTEAGGKVGNVLKGVADWKDVDAKLATMGTEELKDLNAKAHAQLAVLEARKG